MIKNKIEAAFKSGLQIIFCFGETLAEKNKKKTKRVIKNQIQRAITNKKFLKKILFAYEPVWSIGSNRIPTTIELNDTIHDIRKFVKSRYRTNKKIKILYGGSVNSSNIEKLKFINQINGYLVGGASQSSKKFIDILKNYYK
jgi:triosephosphate isomerase